MYNKLFSKIVDSSIWIEPYPVRIVWVAMVAVMDEDGFVAISTHENLARRAGVTTDEAVTACNVLESPDPNSATKEHDGRRIERVPGGWVVLNAKLYRDLAKREDAKRLTRERVRKHRERCNADVTVCNGDVTECTPSEAYTEAEECTEARLRAVQSHTAHSSLEPLRGSGGLKVEGSRSQGAKKRGRNGKVERALVAYAASVFGAEDMATYGGAWRNRIRENPDLVRRVLADTENAVKEGRVEETPAAYANDVYGRWK